MTTTTMRGPGPATTEARFFESSAGLLFGITHVPDEPNGTGVVIASPLKLERMKNARRQVELSRNLAAKGFTVQRFDFRGAGYSDGDGKALTFDHMFEDAMAATQVLQARIELNDLVFVGTRLAGLTAARVAAEFPGSSLALWDPPASGKTYFKALFRMMLMREATRADEGERTTTADIIAELESSGSFDMMGFSIGAPLYNSVQDQELAALAGDKLRRALITQVRRSEGVSKDLEAIAAHWREAGIDVTTASTGKDESWWFQADGYDPADYEELNAALLAQTTTWIEGGLR